MKHTSPRSGSFHRVMVASLVLAASLVIAAPPARAQTPDPVLQETEALFTRAISAKGDASVLTHLRTLRDAALLPLFEYVAAHDTGDLQIYAMVSCAALAKDPKYVDVPKLLKSQDANLVGTALAFLIDNEAISDKQLLALATDLTADPAQRAIAASELDKRKALADRELLKGFLADKKDAVRYYAAVTLLQSADEAERTLALTTLLDLSKRNNPRAAPLEALMMVRVKRDKIVAAAPWVEAVARNVDADEGLRLTALGTLLSIDKDRGAALLGDMLAKQTETITQVKLALLALEYPQGLKPAQLAPLERPKSALVRELGDAARAAVSGGDPLPGLEKVLTEGHPIVLNWSLGYAENAPPAVGVRVRMAVINQAAIVDDRRADDYERASVAAQKLADEDTPETRAALKKLLGSDNPAVVEAVLLGLFRTTKGHYADLVLPVWEKLGKTPDTVPAANFAAFLLGREGKTEAKDWLGAIVRKNTDSAGYRAVAGWYYAKLTHQADALIQRVIAAAKPEGK